MKIRKMFQRAAALALAAVTALSVMPATTAFAAGDIGTISFTHTYDSSGNAMRYNSSASIGGYTAGGTGEYKYRMYVDGEDAFCIQPGVPLKTGNTLKKASSDTWNALSANQKKAVGLALLYGYQGNKNNLSGSDDEKWLATQTLEEDGKTYQVEHEAGKGFLNEAQKGSLKIVKTSSDGKVEGFSFRVIGDNGYDQTFKTDKNGEIVIDGLRIGEYTVSEVSDKASSGYILPADQKVTVKTDETVTVTMHNELRDTPKTGDDFNPALWGGLAAACVIGAGVLGFAAFKGRKKKED